MEIILLIFLISFGFFSYFTIQRKLTDIRFKIEKLTVYINALKEAINGK